MMRKSELGRGEIIIIILEKTLMLENIEGRRKGGIRG